MTNRLTLIIVSLKKNFFKNKIDIYHRTDCLKKNEMLVKFRCFVKANTGKKIVYLNPTRPDPKSKLSKKRKKRKH